MKLRKLVYWVSSQTDDNPCYNLRAKTRRECTAMRVNHDVKRFSKPKKVTIQYLDTFDLLDKCLGEGGIYEE